MRKLALGLVVLFGLAGSARAEPPTTHEIIYTKPSGFWTSNRPAEGGAYRSFTRVRLSFADLLERTQRNVMRRKEACDNQPRS